MVANFDSAPTADSEFFGKLDSSIRDEHESRVSLCCGLVQLSLSFLA